MQEYKDSLKSKAEELVLKGFPDTIVKLNEIMETPQFHNRELADVHQDLNIPVPDPVVINNSNLELPPAKRPRYENTTDGTKVMALPHGSVPINKNLTDLISIVKPHIRKLVEDLNLVSYLYTL